MSKKRLAFLSALIFFVSGSIFFTYNASRPDGSLPRWVTTKRLLQPRLTGGFRYRPWVAGAISAAPSVISNREWRELDAATANAKRARRGEAPVETIYKTEAILTLARQQDPPTLRTALAKIESALAHAPGSAPVQSDVTALRFGLAVATDDALLALQALAAADEAVRLDPRLPEALFNRALLLEWFALWNDARAAWQTYLQVDPSSEWSAEARDHLARLPASVGGTSWKNVRPAVLAAALRQDGAAVQSAIDPLRSAARKDLENRLLADWGRAVIEATGEAGARLTQARELAAALERLNGDSFYRQTTDRLAAASQSPGSPALLALASAHRDFGDGMAQFDVSHIPEALELFRRAEATLSEQQSPFRWRAALKVAICLQRQEKKDEALARLDEVETEARDRGYPLLRGEALWMAGLTYNNSNALEQALSQYRAALTVLTPLQDVDDLVGIHSLLSERLSETGQQEEAWYHLHATLALMDRVSSPFILTTSYFNAGYQAALAGLPRLALLFQNESVLWAERRENPLHRAEAYRWRAHYLFLDGQLATAASDLERARLAIDSLPAGEDRERAEAGFRQVESELLQATDAPGAIERLERNLNFYREESQRLQLADQWLALARVMAKSGQAEPAAKALQRTLALCEKARLGLSTASERVSYLELVSGAFDESIALELRRGRSRAAFEILEQKRARTLLDRLLGEATDPLAVPPLLATSELLAKLPPDLAVVSYGVAGRQLHAWVLADRQLRFFTLPVDLATLPWQVESLRRDLSEEVPKSRTRVAREELYRGLIAPLEAAIAGATDLVIVPDGTLHRLSFAVLTDPTTGQYLIEKHGLATAPSANAFLALRSRDLALAGTWPPRLLAVGSDHFAAAAYPRLRPLPAVSQEVADIGRLYGTEALLRGDAATEEAFLAQTPTAEIVHFAGHAVLDSATGHGPALLLAPAPAAGDSGTLLADEIPRDRFTATRLVVLSACNTASGEILSTEGALSLARPFLAAGVPAVVASLWDVNDRVTASFMVDFHRHLASARSASEALRQTQLAALRSAEDPRSPEAWAAFELIGEASFAPRDDASRKGQER